jgi:glycogen operon protein
MLLAGDEIDRTQRGNNNAYCQDDHISWTDWTKSPHKDALLEFTRRMVRLRREHGVFRRSRFFRGEPVQGGAVKDAMWLKPDGGEMSDQDWHHPHARCLGVYLSGEGFTETDALGRPLGSASFLILFNAHHDAIDFRLPEIAREARWLVVLDTAYEDGLARNGTLDAGAVYTIAGGSLALLQQISG